MLMALDNLQLVLHYIALSKYVCTHAISFRITILKLLIIITNQQSSITLEVVYSFKGKKSYFKWIYIKI